jgi:predicted RNase H-like HicB family nuclease
MPRARARFIVETEREEDGRWIAEISALPGVMAYGATGDEAIARAQALALRVLADRLEQGEAVGAIEALFEAARPAGPLRRRGRSLRPFIASGGA